jgi:hypothetical protein
VVVATATADHPDMKKRTLSAVLWLLSGWYVGNILAAVFGVDPLLGPALGAMAAVFVAGDPFRLIWPTPLIPHTSHRPTQAQPA